MIGAFKQTTLSSIGFIEKPQMAWPYAIFKLPNFNHV